MARGSYKPLFSAPNDELESPIKAETPPRPVIPGITRPEKIINPEMKKERFRRLAGMLKKPQI